MAPCSRFKRNHVATRATTGTHKINLRHRAQANIEPVGNDQRHRHDDRASYAAAECAAMKAKTQEAFGS
jgi:hypothetical protein